jgi:1,4-alpha-glucan branching enzyme
MAISKQYLKSKPVCKVTFTVPAKEASKVSVVGDFNNWDSNAASLRKLKNGTFKGIINLEKNTAYEFKYVVDGSYINDDSADSYAWNSYAASENGVLEL